MSEFLTFIIKYINQFHNWILNLNDAQGWAFTDKQLHFWIFGLGAMLIFFVVQVVFKLLAKWSMTAISFIFTFTVLLGLALAIEVGQRVTKQGVMDFNDIVSGVNGFLVFFAIYFIFELISRFIKSLR
jgi:glycopeptide antibiotics resistance protein